MAKLQTLTVTILVEGDIIAAYEAVQSMLDEGVLQDAAIAHNRALEGKPFTIVNVEVR